MQLRFAYHFTWVYCMQDWIYLEQLCMLIIIHYNHLHCTFDICQNTEISSTYEIYTFVYLQRISEWFLLQRYRNEFNTNLALMEVYKYAKKYRNQVSHSSYCLSSHLQWCNCPERVWACRQQEADVKVHSWALIELISADSCALNRAHLTWKFNCMGACKTLLIIMNVQCTTHAWRSRFVFGFSLSFLSVRELWFFFKAFTT